MLFVKNTGLIDPGTLLCKKYKQIERGIPMNIYTLEYLDLIDTKTHHMFPMSYRFIKINEFLPLSIICQCII